MPVCDCDEKMSRLAFFSFLVSNYFLLKENVTRYSGLGLPVTFTCPGFHFYAVLVSKTITPRFWVFFDAVFHGPLPLPSLEYYSCREVYLGICGPQGLEPSGLTPLVGRRGSRPRPFPGNCVASPAKEPPHTSREMVGGPRTVCDLLGALKEMGRRY